MYTIKCLYMKWVLNVYCNGSRTLKIANFMWDDVINTMANQRPAAFSYERLCLFTKTNASNCLICSKNQILGSYILLKRVGATRFGLMTKIYRNPLLLLTYNFAIVAYAKKWFTSFWCEAACKRYFLLSIFLTTCLEHTGSILSTVYCAFTLGSITI
jgi:hypothetical protein